MQELGGRYQEAERTHQVCPCVFCNLSYMYWAGSVGGPESTHHGPGERVLISGLTDNINLNWTRSSWKKSSQVSGSARRTPLARYIYIYICVFNTSYRLVSMPSWKGIFHCK